MSHIPIYNILYHTTFYVICFIYYIIISIRKNYFQLSMKYGYIGSARIGRIKVEELCLLLKKKRPMAYEFHFQKKMIEYLR